MEKIISDFQKNIEKIFSGKLISIILYDSTVSDIFPHPRNINIMVIVSSIEDDNLLRFRDVAGRFQKKGITKPIFMDADFFKKSSSIFPLEYMEIEQMKNVVHGNDPFEELQLDLRNLPYQVEFELRGKLVLLRKILFSTPIERDLAVAMNETISSIMTLLRGLLVILGKEGHPGWKDTIDVLSRVFATELEGIREIVELRAENKLAKNPASLFLKYMKDLENICSFFQGFNR